MTINKMLIAASIFFSMHIAQSFLQLNYWPLSSFSMYSETLCKENQFPILKLHLKDGTTRNENPLNLLPSDYYKSIIFLRKTFYEKGSYFYEKRALFFKMLIQWNKLSDEVQSVEVYSINMTQFKSIRKDWFEHIVGPVIYSLDLR